MFWRMILRSMGRRRREMRFVSAVTFIAVFFLSAVTVFQNVMDRYVRENDLLVYGGWILSSVKDLKDETVRFLDVRHPYIDGESVCTSGEGLLNEKLEPTGLHPGTAGEGFAEMGNITVYEGRLPREDGEVAMDLPALAALGYSYDLGQDIKLTVSDAEGKRKEKEFTLTGTIKSFSENWNADAAYPLPGALVTENALEELGGAAYETHFYQLGEAYRDIDAQKFSAPFIRAEAHCTFNSGAYSGKVWGSEEMFLAFKGFLILVAAAAAGYLLMAYEAERRRWYYQYRTIGADRSQIREMILVEGMYGIFPFALAAMVFPHLAAALICLIVSKWKHFPYLYEFHAAETLIQAGIIFAVLFFVILGTWLGSGDKVLSRNTREVTERQLKRLRRSRRGNTLKMYYRRQGKLYPLRRFVNAVLAVAICTLAIFCAYEISRAAGEYRRVREELADFTAEKRSGHTDSSEEESGGLETRGIFFDMYDGISRETQIRLEEMEGVSRLLLYTMDERHTAEWPGKENDGLIRYYRENGIGLGSGGEQFLFFRESGDALEWLRAAGGTFSEDGLDMDAFERGEQVFVYTPWVELNWMEDGQGEAEKLSTIHAGDRIEIKSRDSKAVNEATVGAVAAAETSVEERKGGIYIVLASEALTEKIAGTEGGEPAYNAAEIDLDWNAAYDTAEKKLASLFSTEEMEYSSLTEYIRMMRDELIQDISIYGVTGLTILIVYLILQMNFYKNRGFYLGREYRLLRNMGVEEKRYLKLTIKDSAKRSLWILPGVPAVLAVTLAGQYVFEKRLLEGQSGITTVHSGILHEWTSDVFWISVSTWQWEKVLWCAAAVLPLLAGIQIAGAWRSACTLEKWREQPASHRNEAVHIRPPG